MSTPLPKLCGADIELGNFIVGDGVSDRGHQASRALLQEIFGLPRSQPCPSPYGRMLPEGPDEGRFDPQDWGRRFLPCNGACAYIDLDHLEICLPEVISAYDHVAAWHAMLRIARDAMLRANAKQLDWRKIQVLANNTDGQGNSYGSHLNFLVTRKSWDQIFSRKLHQLLYLASYQVSSIIFTGQGKVGSENGAPHADFQIAQRADFFETLTATQTTFRRPLVNSRDESLCGDAGGDLARLHVIFFDNTLCHVSSLLKVGIMQLILTQLEMDFMNPGLILDDPLDAVVRWSHDPYLSVRVKTASGKEVTAVEHQLMFLEEARRFRDRFGFDGCVPRAGEILDLWEDTLLKLHAHACRKDTHAFESLAHRLDWVLKFHILKRAIELQPELTWRSPEIKYLDHIYSSLDLEEGLYWNYENNGLVEPVVSEEAITHFKANPPEDTRAWTRAMLLRYAGWNEVESVNWDSIQFRIRLEPHWFSLRKFRLPNPLAGTKELAEPAFQTATCLDDLLDKLEEPSRPIPSPSGGCRKTSGKGDCLNSIELAEGGHDEAS